MTVHDRLTDLLDHRRVDGDTENNAVLDALIGGIADGMDRLALVAFGAEGVPAERVLRDPRYAPLWALAHAAMYTGAIVPGRRRVLGATNEITNPSFELDTAFWGTATGNRANNILTRVDTRAKVGTWSGRVTADAAAAAGDTAGRMSDLIAAAAGDNVAMRVAGWNAGTCATLNLRPRFIAADGTTLVALGTQQASTVKGAWIDPDLQAVWVAPANTAFVRFEVYGIANAAGETFDFNFDAMLLAKEDAVPDYFDGDNGGVWTGAAHASTSRKATPETDEEYLARARDAAAYPLGIKRGTHEAIRRAVQPLLTGTKAVFIDDDPGNYTITVRTRTDETPDPDAVRLAVEGDYVSSGRRGAMGAELQLVYVVSDDQVINEMDSPIDTFTATTIDNMGGA